MYNYDSIRFQSIHTKEQEVKVGLLSQPTNNISVVPAKKRTIVKLHASLEDSVSSSPAHNPGPAAAAGLLRPLTLIEHERVHAIYPSGAHHGAQLKPSSPIYQT